MTKRSDDPDFARGLPSTSLTLATPTAAPGAEAALVDNSATIATPSMFGDDGAATEEVVQKHLRQLEEWAQANRRDARYDQFRFWAFKIPALLGATSTAAFEAVGLGKVVIFIGVISAVCVGIDGLFPGGRLYNVHTRAWNDLRLLSTLLATEWDRIKLEHPDGTSRERVDAAIKLLERIQREREHIGTYIAEGEASLGRGGSDSTSFRTRARG